MDFSKRYYVVATIDGDYVHLKEIDEAGQYVDAFAEAKLVARALVPDGVSEGDRLVYELLQYRICH